MHPQLALIVAQQHIADLHRAADHDRLVHTATTATSTRAVPRTPTRRRRASVVPVPAPPVAWLKRTRWWSRSSKRTIAAARRLEPREDQAGDYK